MGVVNPSTFTILTYRPFEPTEISGIKGWWKADSIAQADGSSISAWLDSSGNEAHMYQSSASAQPTLQTNELNGYPVVRFDGTNDFMNLTAPFDVQPTNRQGVNSCVFSPNDEYYVHLLGTTSPYFFIYKRNGNVFNKLNNPATLPTGSSFGCSWSPDSTYLVINHNISPYVTIYKRSGDTFTKLANPATLPNSYNSGSGWSYDGNYLAMSGGFTSPAGRFFVYKRSGDTFTPIANPAVLPSAGDARATKFSTNDIFVAVASQVSPYILFYSFNKSTDTLTKLTDPTILPTSEVFSLDWLDDETCAVGYSNSSVIFYKYNGTKFEQNSTLNTGLNVIYSLSYSKNKNYFAVATDASPYFRVYSRSGSTYTALPSPESIPLGSGRGVSFGVNDNFLGVAHANSPFAQMYTFDGTTLTNLTKLNMFRNVGGATVFHVVKYAAGTATDTAFTVLSGTGGYRIVSFKDNTTNLFRTGGRRLDANTAQFVTSTQTASASSFYIQTGLYDFNNSNLYQYINSQLDGTTLSFQTDGTTSNTDSIAIYLSSTGDFLNGDIAEVIAFNRALTTAEIRDVHYYLSAKYNITLAT